MNLDLNKPGKVGFKLSNMGMGRVITYCLLAILFMITVSNTHVINDTEVGVTVKMGKISDDVKTTGLAFTTPFIEELRIVDTTETKKEYLGISLATKADAASPATGNLVITFAIKGTEAPNILRDFGTVERFIDTRLNQLLLSKARIAASGVADTRTLMTPESRVQLGKDLQKALNESHSGYDIRNVMVQSIIPHKTIAKRINDAAQRAEDDVIEQHNLTLATSVALTKAAEADGNEKVKNAASRASAFEVTSKADADAHEINVIADAKYKATLKEAEGNIKLSKTLTPNILRKQELDNEAILFSKSRGLVPSTVIGKTDLRSYGFPITSK